MDPLLRKRASFSNLIRFDTDTQSTGAYPYQIPADLDPQQGSLSGDQQAAQQYNQRSLYFDSHFPLYTADWTSTTYGQFIAVSTCNEETHNRLHVLSTKCDSSGVPVGFTNIVDGVVELPQSKVIWDPHFSQRGGANQRAGGHLMSAGDCLRLWSLDIASNQLYLVAPLVKRTKSAGSGPSAQTMGAPLTGVDWSVIDPNIVISSSIDTTCTVWDLATQSVRMQLIAHDSEVYDVGFVAESPHKFVTAGADGSVRLFDLRSLDSSTIFFELQEPRPLLRVAPNPSDANVVATIAQESNQIYIVDIRASRNPVYVLEGHSGPVNAIKWQLPLHPGMGSNVLASGGDDCQVLIWDLQSPKMNPLKACFNDSGQVNNLVWSPDGGCIASVSGRSVQGVLYRA